MKKENATLSYCAVIQNGRWSTDSSLRLPDFLGLGAVVDFPDVAASLATYFHVRRGRLVACGHGERCRTANDDKTQKAKRDESGVREKVHLFRELQRELSSKMNDSRALGQRLGRRS